MGGVQGRSVVVEEDRPLGDPIRLDHEPRSRRVRSWFGENIERNRPPAGIQWPKLEMREIELDRARVWAKKGMDFGGDDWRIAGV